MTWYKDILHLFTKLSEQSFQNIINYGSHTRAILNLVVSTIVLYIMTYSLPFMVKVISPLLGIKRITGLTHFDLVSTLASSTFLIFQIIIGSFVIWRLLILVGGHGTHSLYECASHGCITISPYNRDYFLLSIHSKICWGYGLSYYDV